MRQFAKMYVLVAPLMKKSIGMPFVTRALSPILTCYLTVTSRKWARRLCYSVPFICLSFLMCMFQGISLSGGQKQRVNICRAIYCDTDIQIFDVRIHRILFLLQLKLFLQDPLSALDAHVGKAVFKNVFQKPGKTRVLVTHALHFLPQVDYIYTIADGCIAERGTYPELMSNNGEFAQFLTEFGSKEEQKEEDGAVDEIKDDLDEKRRNATAGAGLMQAEERNTGAVDWSVYKSYSVAGRGSVMLPLLFIALVLFQGATVMSSYWYVFPCDFDTQFNDHLVTGWCIGKRGASSAPGVLFNSPISPTDFCGQEMATATGFLCMFTSNFSKGVALNYI